jgi:hypothetical protein
LLFLPKTENLKLKGFAVMKLPITFNVNLLHHYNKYTIKQKKHKLAINKYLPLKKKQKEPKRKVEKKTNSKN